VDILFVEIIQPTHTNLSNFGMLAAEIDQNGRALGQSADFSEKAGQVAERLRCKGNIYSIQLPRCMGHLFRCNQPRRSVFAWSAVPGANAKGCASQLGPVSNWHHFAHANNSMETKSMPGTGVPGSIHRERLLRHETT
jgi:hypothetical protein